MCEYLDPQDMYWSLCSSHDLTCHGVCCLVVTPHFPCDNDSCTCNNLSNSLAIMACYVQCITIVKMTNAAKVNDGQSIDTILMDRKHNWNSNTNPVHRLVHMHFMSIQL